MKTNKFSIFSLTLFIFVLTANAQRVDNAGLINTNNKFIGEDLLGIKSGADPSKSDPKRAGRTRKKGRPVVFLIGDSTMKNGQDNGSNNQWGWGHFFWETCDTTKVSVENHALGGRSSRTFITEGLWDKVLQGIQKGDFVLIQFGHNDSGAYNTGRARASLPGNAEKDTIVVMESTGKQVVVRSFGWYMRKYAQDVKAKGATPILLSHIPRNMFTNNDSTAVIRNDKGFGAWTREAAKMENVVYLDANNLIANQLDKLGKDSIQPLYFGDHTHTSLTGAILNAKLIAQGLKSLNDKKLKNLKKALK